AADPAARAEVEDSEPSNDRGVVEEESRGGLTTGPAERPVGRRQARLLRLRFGGFPQRGGVPGGVETELGTERRWVDGGAIANEVFESHEAEVLADRRLTFRNVAVGTAAVLRSPAFAPPGCRSHPRDVRAL